MWSRSSLLRSVQMEVRESDPEGSLWKCRSEGRKFHCSDPIVCRFDLPSWNSPCVMLQFLPLLEPVSTQSRSNHSGLQYHACI